MRAFGPGPVSAVVAGLLCLGLAGSGKALEVRDPGFARESTPPSGLSQEATPPSGHPGDALRVYLMTMGQGDVVWELFSHNAIVVRNVETGWSMGYNWGVFDFDQVDFIPRLIKGTMLYRMAPFDPDAALAALGRIGRDTWLQELALTPTQKADLLAFLQWNAMPENQFYRYDYYRDNCSTRARDALDQILGGAIQRSAEADTTATTYRWHTRRLLRGAPPYYVGIQVVLGASADRPITAWEEMFLPIKLMEGIRSVQVPDGDGGMRPLVADERQVVEGNRPPIPTDAPFALPWFLLVGLLWGGGILALARRGTKSGWLARLGLTVLGGGWALAATLAGVLLAGAWAFTDHVFWYRNMNLLQMNPLFLPIPIALLLFLFRGRFPRWGRDMAAALAVMASVGLLMSLLPGMKQRNGEILALTVPVNLALAVGLHWLVRGGSGPQDGARPPEA